MQMQIENTTFRHFCIAAHKIAGEGQRIALASSANKDEVAYYKNLAQIDEFVTAETSADDVKPPAGRRPALRWER